MLLVLPILCATDRSLDMHNVVQMLWLNRVLQEGCRVVGCCPTSHQSLEYEGTNSTFAGVWPWSSRVADATSAVMMLVANIVSKIRPLWRISQR